MEADFDLNADAIVQAASQAVQTNPSIRGELAKIGGGAASGAAIGALLGSEVPIIGNIIGGVVGAVVGAIAAVVPDVLHALHGQCTITIAGQDADCGNYAANVQEAARWVKANPGTDPLTGAPGAVQMTPDHLSAQTHVLVEDFSDWFTGRDRDYKARIQDSGALDSLRRLPGCQSILRAVQIPAATLLATAAPELLSLYRATFPNNFPALLPSDLAKIFASAQPFLDAQINAAITWSNAQPNKPSTADVHARFPQLLPIDVTRVVNTPPTTTQQVNADVAHARGAIAAQGGVSIGAVAPVGLNISGTPSFVGAVAFVKNADGSYAKDAQGNYIIDHAARAPSGGAVMPPTPPKVTTSSGGHMVISLGGTPTITPGQAAGIVAAVPTDPASAGYANDTIAAARAGNAIAAANAQLLTIADKLNEQAIMVGKWVGQAAADGIRTGYHIGVPAGSIAASRPAIPIPAPAATTTVTPMLKTSMHTSIPLSSALARTAGRPAAWLRR